MQIFGKGGIVTARDIHGGLVVGYAEQIDQEVVTVHDVDVLLQGRRSELKRTA